MLGDDKYETYSTDIDVAGVISHFYGYVATRWT